jgi:hypothetical protein
MSSTGGEIRMDCAALIITKIVLIARPLAPSSRRHGQNARDAYEFCTEANANIPWGHFAFQIPRKPGNMGPWHRRPTNFVRC